MPDTDLRPHEHNEIPIYSRPWYRLFRKTPLWVCVRCNQERPRTPGVGDPDKDWPLILDPDDYSPGEWKIITMCHCDDPTDDHWMVARRVVCAGRTNRVVIADDCSGELSRADAELLAKVKNDA